MRIAFVLLLTILLPVVALGSAPSYDPAAISQAWLQLVDEQDYSGSWHAAGTLFQGSLPEERWVDVIAKVRGPLGTLSKREVSKVTTTKSLPGLPDGDYTIVEFQTSFANKESALETITLIPDDGVPKVGGYFIK